MSTYDCTAGRARDSVTGQPHLHGDEPTRTKAAGIVRSLLLGAAVFTLAAMTGVLLAGTAPVAPAEVATVEPLRSSQQAKAREASEATFAQSMVYSGTAGLTLSVAGMVMVGRRRRFW